MLTLMFYYLIDSIVLTFNFQSLCYSDFIFKPLSAFMKTNLCIDGILSLNKVSLTD